MKSKNKLSKLIVFLILLATIAMIFVANTYSKYATNASGSDSVVVAKWSFTVNDKEIAVAGDAETIGFNLFETIYDSNGEDEETDVADGVIAPGTSGEFEFALKNTSEVTAQYAIKLAVDNTNIPLEFSFDGEEWTSDLTNLIAQDNLAMDASKSVKVMWRWAFGADTATDISLSEQTVNVSATITAVQAGESIEIEEVQLFTDLSNIYENVDRLTAAVKTSSPFAYQNFDLFSGKTITKIGIPVLSVAALDENQTFTLHVVDNTTLVNGKIATIKESYELKLPLEQLGDSTTVNKYVYVDLTPYNIDLDDNETLGFMSPTDSIELGYVCDATDLHIDKYRIVTRILEKVNFVDAKYSFVFDVFAKEKNEVEIPDEEIETPDYGTQLFTDLEFSSEDIARFDTPTTSSKPFAYQNTEFFSGKTITKIGIPVLSVAALDENQTFTLHVIDKTKLSNGGSTTINRSYQLKLPLEQLGNSKTVNKYVYVDLLKYNISLTEDETLAFMTTQDTVTPGYICNATDLIIGTKYAIATHVTNKAGFYDNMNFVFDIYAKDNEVVEPETSLKTVLSGKNFSILGDSISTFKGYSDDATNTNSTIGSNVSHYGKGTTGNPVTNVNATWWMQAANETGMNVLVNNSYSGDSISVKGITRATQLHDNTGNNQGTNPDIIAVYMGINDVKNDPNLSATAFGEDYTEMITNIKTTYPDADIFVFTLLPYTCPTAEVTEMGAEEIEVFNQEIRNVAASNNCTVVDLFNNSGITEDNYMSDYIWDYGLHPNEAGMDAITNTFINALSAKYLNNN